MTEPNVKKFRKKPVEIEAITFDELVEHGRVAQGTAGIPWSFSYKGHPITHENDDCYLIPTLEGTLRFTRDDMLITGVKGEIYPCKRDIFEATYDQADAARNQIREEFDVHMLNVQGIIRAKDLAAEFSALLNKIEKYGGAVAHRELALARTQLQTASFWAKRAMALNPENQK